MKFPACQIFYTTCLALLLTACIAPQAPAIAGYVDFQKLQPLPTRDQTGAAPLRVAIAAVISPQSTIQSYQDLLIYLGEHLNRPVELVQRRTYLEINDLIAKGGVDLAFVCTSAYIAGHDKFGMELLVAPQVEGQTVYTSALIVPANSLAQSMADLQGKVFAFTDPISLSGRMYPTYLVQQSGYTPEDFFARTFFTYSHDDAIQAVANELADGAAVDSLVLDFSLKRDPALAEKIRVIHRSPPFGIPPVVVNPAIQPQLKSELQSLLQAMHQDPAGKLALQAIGVERFVLIEDEAYQDARLMLKYLAQTVEP